MLTRTPWEKVLPSPLGPWAIVKWVLIEVQQAGMAAVASDIDILSGPLPPGEPGPWPVSQPGCMTFFFWHCRDMALTEGEVKKRQLSVGWLVWDSAR